MDIYMNVPRIDSHIGEAFQQLFKAIDLKEEILIEMIPNKTSEKRYILTIFQHARNQIYYAIKKHRYQIETYQKKLENKKMHREKCILLKTQASLEMQKTIDNSLDQMDKDTQPMYLTSE